MIMENRQRAKGKRRREQRAKTFYSLLFTLCASLFALCSVASPALAEGLSGWANLNRNSTEQYENGKKTSANDLFNRNFYLNLNKAITPVLSYQLYLRTSLTDSHSTNADGAKTSTYQRALEPAIDFFLKNPMYNFDAGYRRQEQWSTAHLDDKGRRTTEFYYSRLSVTPFELPSLLLQYDRQKDYDYLSPSTTDSVMDRYAVSSAYKLNYKNIDSAFNFYYTRTETKTPIGPTSKTISDSFTGIYNIGYTKAFAGGLAAVSTAYQGNYARNKTQQLISKAGSNAFRRLPVSGLYAKGSDSETTPGLPPHATADPANINALSGKSSLIDAVNDTNGYLSPTDINLGQNLADPVATRFHNIGIQLFSSDRSVDTLSLYVRSDSDVTGDAGLTNWKVYRSELNTEITNQWISVAVQTVTITVYDAINRVYRIDIKFSAQNATYYKIINQNSASVSNVFVTELEAYGTDATTDAGKTVDASLMFNQGFNLSLTLRPLSRLNFVLSYLINKTDTNPSSLWDSIGVLPAEMFSKGAKGKGEKLKSNITRTYGIASTWMAHRLLTTTARVQRNEAYDNKKELDSSSNVYSLAFASTPLPTVSTGLTLTRSDSFNFGIKQTSSNSVLLNLNTKLYRDINMITDLGYEQSKTMETGATSKSQYIRGTIDAPLTARLFTTFIYGINSTTSGGKTVMTQDANTIITYRPSRLVNLSGTFRLQNTDGKVSTSEGFLVDWLPLPVTKLNLSYQHLYTATGPSTSDTISSYVIWYITKFLDLQVTYGFTQTETDKKTKGYNLGLNLNCRFW